MKHLIRGGMAMAMALLALTGCGDDIVVSNPEQGVRGVVVAPATQTLAVGAAATLVATVDASAGVSTDVDWTSADTTIATVSATGRVVAVRTGQTAITAISRANPSRFGTALIIVSGSTNSGVLGVTVTPSTASVSVGRTVTAVADVRRNAGVSGQVLWGSASAAVATVSPTGVITGVGQGTAVIIARAQADTTQKATVVVTVTQRQNAVTGLTVTPTTLTLKPAEVVRAAANVTTFEGATATITWSTTNAAIATVSSTGDITGVADGTTVIRATAKAAGDSLVADIPVTVRTPVPAQIAISSITQGGLQTPVSLSNVTGQIEVSLTVAPGEQSVDSIAVFVGGRRAAQQSFTSSLPAQSTITLSINTADYTRLPSGLVQVSYLNGPTNISAVLYPKTGASLATNATSLVLANVDGFAATMTAPTRNALDASGVQWHGGPGVAGAIGATLYPVFYTPGRTVSYVDVRFGTGPTQRLTTAPYRVVFGTGDASITTDYITYASVGLENINIVTGQDQIGGALPVGLLSNTVVFGSTPTPIRVDFAAPAVGAPSVVRAAPAVTGWVNASFNLINSVTTDAGIGLKATRDRGVTYSAPDCGGAVDVAMPTGTGADIAECASNPSGGSSPTGPYTAKGFERDRLENVGVSAASARFGVDKTAPQIRRNSAAIADSARYGAVPVATFSVDYLDNRSGFYNSAQPLGGTAAQSHTLARSNAAFPSGTCATGTGTPGAAFVTAPSCVQVPISTPAGAVLVDSWQQGASITMPAVDGYVTYTTSVTDAAGNQSASIVTRALLDGAAPVVASPSVPASLTGASIPTFTSAYTDNVEIRGSNILLTYPNVGDLVYAFEGFATRFDNAINASGNITRGLPYAAPFVRRIERVTAGAFPASNIAGLGTPVNVKPTAVVIAGIDQRYSAGASPAAAIAGAGVEAGLDFAAYNAANPTTAVTHFRILPLSPVAFSGAGLKAEAIAATGTSGSPFARVDFYRQNGATFEYLGSATTFDAADNGTYRSIIYRLTTYGGTSLSEALHTAATAGETVIAVGVTAAGDGLATLNTVIVP